MEKPDLKDTVSVNLRSLILCSKGGVPLHRLERDYKDFLGTHIPFRDLGYSSLEAFLRAIPNVVSLKRERDGVMVEAVADSSTAHIASLVSRQKQSKTRPTKRGGFSAKRGGFTSKYSYRGGRSSYGSYNNASKFSGRTYKQDFKPPANHPRTSPTNFTRTSPTNFTRTIDNTNHIPKEPAQPKATSTASFVPPLKAKTKSSVAVRGYEVAPRFLKQIQRQTESNPSGSSSPVLSNSSSTPTGNSRSVTPPRTPTPTQYFPSIGPLSAPSIPPPRQPTGAAASSSGAYPTSTASERNGYYSSAQKNPRPLRARLTLAKSDHQLDAAQTAKEYIEIYARMNNISVNYSTSPIGQKRKNKGFVSNLNLGENKYLSYPNVAQTEDEAEEIAAQLAVNKIKESQVLPETPISNAAEIEILLNRIEEIVCEKPSGMFINGLQQEYENHHREQLPVCWLELLQGSSVVDIDEIEVSYGKVPDGANFIVRPAKGLSSGSTTPSETSVKIYPELQDSESDEVTPREDQMGLAYPTVPDLMIPHGNEWDIYVTDVSQFVAARLINNDNEFLALSRMMSTYYDSNILPVQEVFEKHLYTTIGDRIEGDLVMHRVIANRILDDDMVQCYYVDEGVTEIVHRSNLQELPAEFLELPYQIIYFVLDGLEEYEPFMKPEYLEALKFGTFISVVKRWCDFPSDDLLPDDPGIHKRMYSVVLYDTSGEVDICVNDTVKESVSKSLVCNLPKLNVSSRGYLTHVTNTGQIYLRFLHPYTSWLETMLQSLYPLFEETCLEPLDIPVGRICVAKFSDDKWYRVVVSEHPICKQEPGMVEVIFVDYGNPCLVKKSDIRDLQLYSEFLSNLDYQAIKCELHNALPSASSKWTVAASQKLSDMARITEELLIRVIVEGGADVLSQVNLHKRIYTKEDSFIISINDNLGNNLELFLDLSAASSIDAPKVPSNLNLQRNTSHLLSKGSLKNYAPSVTSPVENLYSLKNLDIASPDGIQWVATPDNVKSPEEEDFSPSSLSPPEVPDTQFFDVTVTLAATPHNFTIQSFKSRTQLDSLMNQMQQFYSVEENLIEMHPSLLQKNGFYAVLHSDGLWYRVRLVSASETLMAYYVDYGDFNAVRLQNLQKLYQPYRKLPCQAIKASLAGIQPIEVDWNPVHCVKFKEMVTEKNFCSIVQRKFLRDENDVYSLELELTLIDTSDSNKDVYIHELLVTNSMALKKT